VMRTASGEYLLTEKGKTMAMELVRHLKGVVQQ